MLGVVYADCCKQARYAECRYAVCHYAECRGAKLGVVYNVAAIGIVIKY